MLSKITILAVVVALSASSRAAMMVNDDLTGLVLDSQAIVVVDRVPGASNKPSHYTIQRSIRGPLAVGSEIEVDDGLFDLAGTDTRLVAFLTKLSNGAWYPAAGGLRVVAGGKVFRFEQLQNPGGFARIPQGHDPQDNWRATPQIDLAELDREIATAIKRADALPAALAITDAPKRRAAVLALLPASGTVRGSGFYTDVLTEQAVAGLGARGDVEGALEASRHDHSALDNLRTKPGALTDVLAIATSGTKPLAIRIAAIRFIERDPDYFANQPAVKAILALLADPVPAIRAAAVTTAARTWDWSTSEPKQQTTARQLARDTHAALARLYATEADNAVLAALVEVYRDHRPERRGGPAIVARLRARGPVVVEVECLQPIKLANGKLIATSSSTNVEVPGSGVTLTCRGSSVGGATAVGKDLAPGTYSIALHVDVASKPVTIPLGTLVVSPDGELAID